MMRYIKRFAPLLLLSSLTGCGASAIPRPELEYVIPVGGTLTYQGRPLAFYQVTFLPTDGRRPAVGLTDAAGRFKLTTNSIGDGAPPGMNKIGVTFAPPSTDDSLTAEPIDDPSLLPKPKIEIPAKYSDPETSGLTLEVPDEGLLDVTLELN